MAALDHGILVVVKSGLRQEFDPVRSLAFSCRILERISWTRIPWIDVRCRISGLERLDEPDHVPPCGILRRIHDVQGSGNVREACHALDYHVDLGVLLFRAVRGHQYDAVCSAGSIDRGGGDILEHGYRHDV